MTDEFAVAGDSLDRLTTIEMRPRGMPRGFLSALYAAAREHYGAPLGLLAARRLESALAAERRVVIIGTTAGRPIVQPRGETDGPIGAALLGRALHVAFGAVPVFVGGDAFAMPLGAAVEASGFTICSLPEAMQRSHGAVLLEVPTIESGDEPQRAAAILGETKARAVIAVERPGPNSKGITHSTRGTASPTPVRTIAELVLGASREGILTVGIGDAGNEVGFGAIAASVRSIHPSGSRCACPCAAGIACAVPADVLVVGSCSNLGSYNVAGALALISGRADATPDPQLEHRVFAACVAAGAEESNHGRALWCDGIPIDAHGAFTRLIQEVLHIETTNVTRSW